MSPLFEDPFYDKYYKGRKPPVNNNLFDPLYYVVFEGLETGIYDEWEDAKAQVNGFSNAKYRKYFSYREAELALCDYLNPGVLPFENRK